MTTLTVTARAPAGQNHTLDAAPTRTRTARQRDSDDLGLLEQLGRSARLLLSSRTTAQRTLVSTVNFIPVQPSRRLRPR